MQRSYRFLTTACRVSNNSVLVFGSNTDVGKTIVSTGMLKFAAFARHQLYIKPVQTGNIRDEDFVAKHVNNSSGSSLSTRTLFHWQLAASPHIAAHAENAICPDSLLVNSIKEEIQTFLERSSLVPSIIVVETAGGVLSPGPSFTLQADIYHSLRIPVVLVGDSKLGGISATLSSFESLYTRGYDVIAVVLIDAEADYGNADAITRHFSAKYSHTHSFNTSASIPPAVVTLSPLPLGSLEGWYQENKGEFSALVTTIDDRIESYKLRLQEMQRHGADAIWWPFTQHQQVPAKDVTMIESACGDNFRVVTGMEMEESVPSATHYVNGLATRDMFDACASWWTQVRCFILFYNMR